MFVSLSKYNEAVERGNRLEKLVFDMEKNSQKMTTIIREAFELNERLLERNIELIREVEQLQSN